MCRLLDQTPAQMGECAVQWAKLVIPLVVHSASKVRLRAAAALEMGLPLLMEKQKEVAAIIEPIMSSVSVFILSTRAICIYMIISKYMALPSTVCYSQTLTIQ